MSRPIFSDEAFADWLAKQPAGGAYSYMNPMGKCDCLIAQYLRAQGMPDCYVGITHWWIGDIGDLKGQKLLPNGWNEVARGPGPATIAGEHWTYGAALNRLREHMAKQVA